MVQQSIGLSASVLDKVSLETAATRYPNKFGSIDILVNGAGGNSPASNDKSRENGRTDNENLEDTFFGLQMEGFDKYLTWILKDYYSDYGICSRYD